MVPNRQPGKRVSPIHAWRAQITQLQQYRNPQSKHLIEKPEFWVARRITELAPKYSNRQIQFILQHERLRNATMQKIPVPTRSQIHQIISFTGLRSREDKNRLNANRQKRSENNLTPDQREQLMAIAAPYIRRLSYKLKKLYGPKVMEAAVEYIKRETRFARLKKEMGPRERKARWLALLKAGKDYFVMLALRKVRIRKKQERESKEGDERRIGQHADLSGKTVQTIFQGFILRKPLTSVESKAIELLQEGHDRKDLSELMTMSNGQINRIFASLRKKIIVGRRTQKAGKKKRE